MVPIPPDYAVRTYAGVLGKLIGVYLGRPFEGWTFERIGAELGDIRGYVNHRLEVQPYGKHLVVTDDDVAGTFVFPRSLADNGFDPHLDSARIGEAWLNHIIEERSVLWWGGVGNSTEQTAWQRLRDGIPAPRSGSTVLNGQTVAEQIGAQIFIDGWAMVSPDNPAQAVRLAGEAARVSHDGAAVHAAQLIAAIEAQAYVEPDMDRLLDLGLCWVPADSLIARVVRDVRNWHAADNERDWRSTRARIAARYGYDKFGGNCHVVPNHALVILALLYGRESFADAMSIVCTAGWDTDCNAGNVGCLMGIRGGLAVIDAGPDWRGPVADRMYLSSADGGEAISDAVRETLRLVEAGHRLAGGAPPPVKDGARFSFAFPGSVQGFQSVSGGARVSNAAGRDGKRRLCIDAARPSYVATPVFYGRDVFEMRTYGLECSPTLYPGQRVCGRVQAEWSGIAQEVRLVARHYGAADELQRLTSPLEVLQPGQEATLHWTVPETGGSPLYDIGFETDGGTLLVDSLTWDGAPDVVLTRPACGGRMWFHAWVNAASHFSSHWESFRLSHRAARGIVAIGTRDWRDYTVETTITPHLAREWGLAVHVQGLRRYLAVLFFAGESDAAGHSVRLVRVRGREHVLATAKQPWRAEQSLGLRIETAGPRVRVWVAGALLFDMIDDDPLGCGGIGLICETGAISTDSVAIRPGAT